MAGLTFLILLATSGSARPRRRRRSTRVMPTRAAQLLKENRPAKTETVNDFPL